MRLRSNSVNANVILQMKGDRRARTEQTQYRKGREAQLVQSIVEKVSKNLDRKIFHVPLHFIGRDHLVQYVNSWLQDGTHGAAIAILYGIGGVGKTAIAKTVYNQNFHKFEG